MARINFGNTWWGEKWLDALKDMDYANRLQRGRAYTNNGSVKDIKIEDNQIIASVQGSRRYPYKVEIECKFFDEKQKEQIIEIINKNNFILSKLLLRELPEKLFTELNNQKIKLFPTNWKDLEMECSCPDYVVPCKHIAAVIFLVANEIDKNPFIVFTLHGLNLFNELQKNKSQNYDGSSSLIGDINFKQISDLINLNNKNSSKKGFK